MNEPLHLVSDAASAEQVALERTGDFEELVQAEHPRLYGALWLITRDRGEAEDVMQEAFLRVWERWDRVKDMDHPDRYLYRTAMNVYRQRIWAQRDGVGAVPPIAGPVMRVTQRSAPVFAS